MFSHQRFIHPMPGWKVTSNRGVFHFDRGDHLHAGWDVTAPDDVPMYAMADGAVYQSSVSTGAGGMCVKVRCPGQWDYRVYHLPLGAPTLARPRVHVGEKVVAGQQLAVVGHSGNATGPHLHVEIRWFGVEQDPLVMIEPVTVLPVDEVQRRLGLTVDGLYGPGTAQAVRAFQQSKVIPPTGSVDVRTAHLLLAA